MGTSPLCSDSTFSSTMSRAMTGWPSSAKQAAVTRPTQPTPITPIGSFPGATVHLSLFRLRIRDDHVRGPCHTEHLVIGKGIEQVIGDPVAVVAAMPGDHI